MNVVVLTTVHPRDDNRIFHKEIPLICSISNCDVTAVVADGLGDEVRDSYKVLDIGASHGRMSRFISGSWRAIFRVKKLKPDVVHFHDPELMFLGVIFSLLGIKVVFDVHENIPEDIKDKHWIPAWCRGLVSSLYKVVESVCVRFFAAIVVATPNIAIRYPAQKLYLVQNYPRLEEFNIESAGSDVGSNKSLITVSYVGAITRIRGVDNIVRAADLLKEDVKVKFKLAGVFQEEGHQQELSLVNGWKYVEFVGKISRSEIGEFLESSDVGMLTLLPANNHINSQPNKLFEYMAAGIPVIASDFPLWRKLIEQYDCGYLVDPDSPESIGGAIKEVYENSAEAKSKGRNGKRAIQTELNWEVESKQLVDCYTELEQRVLGNQ